MKYIAQPYYAANTIGIYSLPAATLTTTINLTAANSGPNGVLLYQDSAAVYYLFVSYDFGSNGGVDVYRFTSIANLIASPPTIGAPTRLNLNNSAVGMAVHPGTGDLYVATFSGGDGNGGVFHYTKGASGYTYKAQFASYQSAYNNVAEYCANLAFDLHGNLWMTTFNDAGTTDQFLICFTQVYPTADSSKFFKFTNGGQIAAANLVTLPGSATVPPGPLYPLSQPEGIAFDPLGNLWLADNCDDFATSGGGNGMLLKINSSWIQSTLQNATLLADLTADGYGGTQTLPTAPANLTAYFFSDARFGGLCFDGFTLYVNDQNDFGDTKNTVVWACNSTNPLSGFKASGVSTTYPGNGTMAIFNAAPPALLIRDYAKDMGTLPPPALPAGTVAWESCDIGISTESDLITSVPLPAGAWSAGDSSTPALQSDGSISIATNTPAYVYVKVANTGSADSTGTEVLKIYWAKGSSSLDWPQPWDGSMFSGSVPLGGLVGAMTLPVVPSKTQVYVMLPWTTTPIPGNYSSDANHFCILARIEGSSLYPYGMYHPEETGAVSTQVPLIDNVTMNPTIAWRNISIITVAASMHRPGIPLKMQILGGNYGATGRHVGFAVETLGREGRPEEIRGQVSVHAVGAALERLRATEFHEDRFPYRGEGRFEMLHLKRGMERVHLHPKEVLPFTLMFRPEEAVRDYAVRVVQYVEVNGVEKVMGGQTFVVGKVKGFPVREKYRRAIPGVRRT
jgi:hypothetical protein